MNFQEACKAIVVNQDEASLNYAVDYAKYGLSIPDKDGEQQRVQALYILNNISKWRGKVAKQVRVALKKVAG